jgi:hypothetical protein
MRGVIPPFPNASWRSASVSTGTLCPYLPQPNIVLLTSITQYFPQYNIQIFLSFFNPSKLGGYCITEGGVLYFQKNTVEVKYSCPCYTKTHSLLNEAPRHEDVLEEWRYSSMHSQHRCHKILAVRLVELIL